MGRKNYWPEPSATVDADGWRCVYANWSKSWGIIRATVAMPSVRGEKGYVVRVGDHVLEERPETVEKGKALAVAYARKLVRSISAALAKEPA